MDRPHFRPQVLPKYELNSSQWRVPIIALSICIFPVLLILVQVDTSGVYIIKSVFRFTNALFGRGFCNQKEQIIYNLSHIKVKAVQIIILFNTNN